MIFKHPFKGVKQGDIYHTDFVPGDVCPPELLEAAVICEVVGEAPTETDGDTVTGDGTGETLPEIEDGDGVEAPTEKATKRKAKAE